MGILSSLKNVVTKFESKSIQLGAKLSGSKSVTQMNVKTIVGLAGLGIISAPAKALSIGKTILSTAVKYPKTAIASVIGTPIVAGYVAKDPLGALKTTAKSTEKLVSQGIPSLVNVGGNIQEFVKDPSLSTAKNIVAENPITTGALALAGLGAVASLGLGGLGVTASNISLERTIKEQQELALGTGDLPVGSEKTLTTLPKEKIVATDDSQPIPAQTETVTTGTSGRRRYTPRKAQKVPSIRINIDNRDNYQAGKIFKHKHTRN